MQHLDGIYHGEDVIDTTTGPYLSRRSEAGYKVYHEVSCQTMKIDATDYFFVPLDVELYAELVRRSGKADVSYLIEHSVETFLDRTKGDPHVWPAEYIDKFAEDEAEAFREEYGDPKRGYQWNALPLPNGTKIRMSYGGQDSYAEVRHERLRWGEETMSPSQFASRVAGGTSRNAWRDLYVQFPGDASWELADSLRRSRR